jgi:hypothetical protein
VVFGQPLSRLFSFRTSPRPRQALLRGLSKFMAPSRPSSRAFPDRGAAWPSRKAPAARSRASPRAILGPFRVSLRAFRGPSPALASALPSPFQGCARGLFGGLERPPRAGLIRGGGGCRGLAGAGGAENRLLENPSCGMGRFRISWILSLRFERARPRTEAAFGRGILDMRLI